MKKEKKQWVDEIIQGLDNAQNPAGLPDDFFLDSLKSSVRTRLEMHSNRVSARVVWAMAASFTILIAANVFFVANTPPNRDTLGTFMKQEGIQPAIPFESM